MQLDLLENLMTQFPWSRGKSTVLCIFMSNTTKHSYNADDK